MKTFTFVLAAASALAMGIVIPAGAAQDNPQKIE